jgi:hypothetical protein
LAPPPAPFALPTVTVSTLFAGLDIQPEKAGHSLEGGDIPRYNFQNACIDDFGKTIHGASHGHGGADKQHGCGRSSVQVFLYVISMDRHAKAERPMRQIQLQLERAFVSLPGRERKRFASQSLGGGIE